MPPGYCFPLFFFLVLLLLTAEETSSAVVTVSNLRPKSASVNYEPSGLDLNQEVLIIVGRNHDIKNVHYEQFEGVMGSFVDQKEWIRAAGRISDDGEIPLYLNQAVLLSVPDSTSRYNSPSNSHAIGKAVRKALTEKRGRKASVIVLTKHADVVSNVAAIARSFPLYSKKTCGSEFHEVNIDILMMDDKALHDEDMTYLSHLIRAVRTAGRLIDTPANEMTTVALVKEAVDIAESLNVNYTLIQGEELYDHFPGTYTVGRAGSMPPAFILLSHLPSGANETYAFVGKGVTFDTGGLNLKKGESMLKMKGDMSGAADVLASFTLLVQSGFKQNIHVILCIAENNISPDAMKPGDVITMLSGKTVEITNTDCEGRLMLADAVYYAKQKLKANTIFDVATMTDNSALSGRFHAAVLTNSEEWEREMVAAGRRSGDLLVPVVFSPELHFPDLSSSVADMMNCPQERQMGPSTAVAALFIGSHIDFGDGLNWIHLNIAFPELTEQRAYGFGPGLFSSLFGDLTTVPLLRNE